MNRALLYLQAHTTAGALRVALSRLKRPRYLIATLAGILYFAVLLFQPLRAARREGLGDAFEGALRPGITLLLAATLCLAWAFGRGGALHFTPAEIDFLFPAPVSRRQLVRYRTLKFQMRLFVMSVLVALVSAGRGAGARSLAVFAGALVIMNVLLLHGVVVAFALGRARRAVRVLCRLTPFALVVGGLLLTYERLGPLTARGLGRWFGDLITLGPAGFVLIPARVLADLALSPDFATFGARLVPALLIAALLYIVVERVDFPFEEFEIEGARRRAAHIDAVRRGRMPSLTGRVARQAGPTRWPLAPLGAPWRAITWKNVVATTRHVPVGVWTMLPILIAPAGLLLFGRGTAGQEGASILIAVIASLLSLLAPLLSREDLRNDLELLDLLKSFPLSGRDLLRGEVLGLSLLVGGLQVGLLLAALLLYPAAGRLPGDGILAVISAGIVALPALTICSFTVVNGLALLLPAWSRFEPVTTGGSSAGVENFGRAMVTGLGQVFALGALLIAPSLVAAAVGVLASFVIGLAAVPLAAVFAAGLLLGENEILLFWLGASLERLDPGEEGLL